MSNMFKNLNKFLSLPFFFARTERVGLYLGILSGALFAFGLYFGFFVAPKDSVQGDAFRIIYVHVPAAFLSLSIYFVLFLASVIYLIWRIKIADILASESAPLGFTFTLIALLTGAIWGKPMWGTWWVWDARLTSELLLLFIYGGIIGLRSAFPSKEKGAIVTAIFTLIGMVDIPIIHFSVEWWSTLHQGATLSKLAKPTMASEMLYPLILMLLAFFAFYSAVVLVRMRANILEREKEAVWVLDNSKIMKQGKKYNAI